jgi:hypothetical protein
MQEFWKNEQEEKFLNSNVRTPWGKDPRVQAVILAGIKSGTWNTTLALAIERLTTLRTDRTTVYKMITSEHFAELKRIWEKNISAQDMQTAKEFLEQVKREHAAQIKQRRSKAARERTKKTV